MSSDEQETQEKEPQSHQLKKIEGKQDLENMKVS
jgi:hypothetical protein